MKLVFHIPEDGSEIYKFIDLPIAIKHNFKHYTHAYLCMLIYE
jgi:hypothetical protein